MIQKPKKISDMSWLQLGIVFLKLLIYIDSADIEELNQFGGAGNTAQQAGNTAQQAANAVQQAAQQAPQLSEIAQQSQEDFRNDLADDADIQATSPNGFKNNFIVFIIREILSIVRKVSKTVGMALTSLFGKFICAATLPALPFFLTMGASYSFIKYASFKIRAI